jgi:triacylglycerol lipase
MGTWISVFPNVYPRCLQGIYLGTLSGVNHLDLVGWVNAARYMWAEMTGNEIEFRPATFYLGIADMLAGEVEGQPKEGEKEGEAGSKTDTAVKVQEEERPPLTPYALSSSPESRVLLPADNTGSQQKSDR